MQVLRATTANRCSSRGIRSVRHSSLLRCNVANPSGKVQLQPSREVVLPNNAVWLLDYLQDRFYNVRGDSFVINRVEASSPGAARKCRKAHALSKAAPPSASEQLSMIHQVVRHHPSSVMLLEGGTVDIDQFDPDVFYTSSTSPRRTKMVGFSCKLCGARTYSAVNPLAFQQGTLVAQCGRFLTGLHGTPWCLLLPSPPAWL
ncbi:predicted protein [Haematococcus lacustris]|uniref:Uncharacterized protein n=1 Tax=Haematococcus lacustris TaxID=44745 RepID=A0A699ZJH6_HAELA|nr:predicted protein [Haematococcus lacustris]